MASKEIPPTDQMAIRNGFKQYLAKMRSNSRDNDTVVSDAFYLLRHDLGITLWDVVEEKTTYDECRERMEEHFRKINHENPKSNSYVYLRSIKLLKAFMDVTRGDIGNIPTEHPVSKLIVSRKTPGLRSYRFRSDIPTPSVDEVEKYLAKWDALEKYVWQERALKKLFTEVYPKNTALEEILAKASVLNDFYKAGIFDVFSVAKHIYNLNIDKRLTAGDQNLVTEIMRVKMENGAEKNFYSFATKYCSHHQPAYFPIYDEYVMKIMCYFRDANGFARFYPESLRDYPTFKSLLLNFMEHYVLGQYSIKDIDRYLWQLGKEKFPKSYGKKAAE